VNALFFLRPVGKQKQLLDTAEAFNLWDILKAKYIHAERMLLWRNFAHDRDLVRHLETHLKDLSKDIFLLEKELEKYGVRGPDKNRTEVKTAANAEVIRDEYIAQDYFIFLQESIEMLLRAFRTSATNDSVRALFQQLLRKTVGQIDSFGKYIKAKGWLEEPPLLAQRAGGIGRTAGYRGSLSPVGAPNLQVRQHPPDGLLLYPGPRRGF
jgi:hypothetical protein